MADGQVAGGSWAFMLRPAETDVLAGVLGDLAHPTVLIVGESGVGKSRLAEHAFERYLATGGLGRRCVAGTSLHEVPFGALVGLIPAHHMAAVAAGTQQLSVFGMVRDHVVHCGATDQRPFVICVDDLHHLDDASCGLLVQLTANAPVQVLATYRSGEVLPDGLLPLWTSSRVVRIELKPFGRADTDEIVRTIMGEATPDVHDALWQHSQGNALFLRELILGSVAAGRIAQHAGTWVLVQPLVSSTHLAEYLLQNVRRLAPEARRLAEMLALCQPLPLPVFRPEELDPLDELIRAGVVGVGVVGVGVGAGVAGIGVGAGANEVRLAHPIFAEVIRHQLTALGERQILADVVQRMQPHQQPGDDMRLTVWQLDAGGSPPVEQLVAAARAAITARDLLLACRLTRAAQAIVPHHPTASLLLADALYEMGHFKESAEEATAALMLATEPDDQALLVASLYAAHMWGLDDPDGALAVVDFAQAVTPPGPAYVRLGVGAANALTFSDRPREGLERLRLLQLSNAMPADVSLFQAVEQASLSQLGRTADALHVPLPPDAVMLHVVVRSFGLTEAGRLDEAAALAQGLRTDLVGVSMTLDQMWSALNAGRAHLMAGRPRTAVLWAGDAMITAERAGLIAGQALITSVLAAAFAQLGDGEAAQRADQRAGELAHVRGFLRAERAVGRAWSAYLRNEHSLARRLLLEAAVTARGAGQLVSESFLLHEHLRLGGEPQAARMRELAEACQSPLVAARATHAAAAAGADAAGLAAAAERFAALGANLAAAEAYHAAARLAPDSGRQATGYRNLADKHRRLCEGATTPLLDQRELLSVSPLSAREQEIAAMAVSGLSAREIGQRLFVSARTVENHLQRVYTKLGVSNRQQLADYYSRP
ncbi:MAG: LuxR C-terminal-related transcriptional regulator [Actinomycetota bacterium]|nr:LuxR C-terminal-related transcriptional regulator [Actinomycetota bacterium]